MRRRHAVVLALALAVVAVIVAGCGAAGLGDDAVRTVKPPSERTPAPAISVKGIDGGRVTLASHRGKPVLVNFWASWCEPCQRETPALVAFSKAHPAIDVIGIAVNDAPGDSRRFARKEGVPYELGLDQAGDVAGDFDVTGLPVTAVIDAEGRLVDTFFGEISAKQLDGYADQIG